MILFFNGKQNNITRELDEMRVDKLDNSLSYINQIKGKDRSCYYGKCN